MFAGTESCIRLVDVDEDGRDDVIFGMTKTEFASGSDSSMDGMKKKCSDAGKFLVMLKYKYIYKITNFFRNYSFIIVILPNIYFIQSLL